MATDQTTMQLSTYLEEVLHGGSISVVFHASMLIACILSVVLHYYDVRRSLLFVCTVAPTLLGAAAMWNFVERITTVIEVTCLVPATSSIVSWLRLASYPLVFGAMLSIFAIVINGIARASNFRHRHAWPRTPVIATRLSP